MGGDHEGKGKGRVRQRSHLGFFPVAFRGCHHRMIALLLVTALHTTTGRLLSFPFRSLLLSSFDLYRDCHMQFGLR